MPTVPPGGESGGDRVRSEGDKPQEVLDLHGLCGRVFEALRDDFAVPAQFPLPLHDVDHVANGAPRRMVVPGVRQYLADLAHAVSEASLDRAERDAEELGDLALREPAPVRELDDRSFVVGQDLERPMHLPGGPRRFGLVRRVGLPARPVHRLRHGLRCSTQSVGDRVARDGVEPRCTLAARGVVRSGRAPDRDEGVLGRVLRSPAVADSPQREAENRACIPPVELVERTAVARCDADDQLAVGGLCDLHALHVRRSRPGSTGSDRERRSHMRCYALASRSDLRRGYPRAAANFAPTASQSTTFHHAAR